ncbi:uncharacterized protein LOC129594668 [Paramacrobiotus metropolitanus]|uniref:uncharacterized protein LOC129594668 n=1 Tax=Paramacrobiotus metropolitanus TaxID=2943436 RepID=UPI002445630C|nr:uncharacterized protein LOC129594668 [Paramacrobiotus metropolitanus]
MLRVLCAIALLCGAVYPQLTILGLPWLSQAFGPNCTDDDQMALFRCSTDLYTDLHMQNQTMQNPEVQKAVETVISGNITITEEQAKFIVDAHCRLLNGSSACFRAAPDRCVLSPSMTWSFQLNEKVLKLCSTSNRYKLFTESVRCNKKLDIFSIIASDPQLPLIGAEISSLMMPSTSIEDISNSFPQRFTTVICRLLNRFEEIVLLEKVNATCGADAKMAYTELTAHIRNMFQCQGR